MLDEAVEAILAGMQKMFDRQSKSIDNLEAKVDNGYVQLRHEIRDLRHDTPSKQEFNDLKSSL